MRERIHDVEGQDFAALVAVATCPPMGRGFFGLQGLLVADARAHP
jgi:hypothetical protein